MVRQLMVRQLTRFGLTRTDLRNSRLRKTASFIALRRKKFAARLFTFFAVNVMYNALGTLTFMWFEGTYFKHNILKSMNKSSSNINYSKVVDIQLREINRRIPLHQMDKTRQILLLQCHLSKPKWDFHTSIHYVYSIVTTIGFGNLTPKSMHSKLITMIFGVVGILLFVLCLAAIRDLIMSLLDWMFGCSMCCSKTHSKRFHMLLIIILVIVLIFSSAAMVTDKTKTIRSFFELVYHSFITVSTIGFGETVIFEEFHESSTLGWARNIYMLIILLCLVLFSALFEFLKRCEVEKLSRRVSRFVTRYEQVSKPVIKKPKFLGRKKDFRVYAQPVVCTIEKGLSLGTRSINTIAIQSTDRMDGWAKIKNSEMCNKKRVRYNDISNESSSTESDHYQPVSNYTTPSESSDLTTEEDMLEYKEEITLPITTVASMVTTVTSLVTSDAVSDETGKFLLARRYITNSIAESDNIKCISDLGCETEGMMIEKNDYECVSTF